VIREVAGQRFSCQDGQCPISGAKRFQPRCRTQAAWSAAIAQLVEHVIRNDGVTGSNPVCGTSKINQLAKSRQSAEKLCVGTVWANRLPASPGRFDSHKLQNGLSVTPGRSPVSPIFAGCQVKVPRLKRIGPPGVGARRPCTTAWCDQISTPAENQLRFLFGTHLCP
jgi:hypothetical protein